MNQIMNVAETYPIFDTIIICNKMYGKEKAINGWYTTFKDFAANEQHAFFKNRIIGSSHLAYCNMDSADNTDFVFKAFSIGVHFFGPIAPDGINSGLESPSFLNENIVTWWKFDLPKHCGMDFRVQQDVIVENTCLATPPGYGPRAGGGGIQTAPSSTTLQENSQPFKVVNGTNGEPYIDNRFPFETPISIPRNTAIEARIYPSHYARSIISKLTGPHDWVLLTENQGTRPPAFNDYFTVPVRFGIQVSLYGYREVQQRGQYHAPGYAV